MIRAIFLGWGEKVRRLIAIYVVDLLLPFSSSSILGVPYININSLILSLLDGNGNNDGFFLKYFILLNVVLFRYTLKLGVCQLL